MKSKSTSPIDTQSSPALGDDPTKHKTEQFPIVGIGASAGGLEALEQFFTHMPANCGMAFVVIQHLDPNHNNILSDLLQRLTQMKVFTVTDRMKIRPECIYVIPSNTSMSIFNGALHLFEPIETRGLRLPIDFFFRSMAQDRREKSIGIILSGMGSDGSAGLKSIKENAGLVLVQEPTTAKFDSMPRSAIDAVVVDMIAPAHELPDKLLTLVKHTPASSAQREIEKDSSSLEKIIIILRSQTGNDFSQYKKNTMYRRIERRMGIHQIDKIATYVRYLRENKSEVDILFKELLIGVTNFFRDPEVWEEMRDKYLPAMIAKMNHGQVLRVWIPACSTGEEAYTLAIIFREAIEKTMPKNITLQIFATDLDVAAIEKARKGCFPINIESDVSADRLNRFFIKKEDQYQVISVIREMVVFASQNVTKDPPFTKLDILSCRNLLIYMDAMLQKKLLALFHYSLNPGGLLLLGSAETNASQNDLFSTMDSKFRIYQRSGIVKKEELMNFPSSFAQSYPHSLENHLPAKDPDNIQTLTDQLLLQQFSPASLLVTEKGDILYITGSTGKYLEPAAGKANMNLFAMAREGLRNELPMAFRNVILSHEKYILRNLVIRSTGGADQNVDVTIQYIEKPLALNGKILIVFNDVEPKEVIALQQKGSKTSGTVKTEMEKELKKLREELQNTREEMQTSQEEMQSTNEEMQSINEEMQSTNEELQSANEELTTSKEEMQSLNEELHTVNAQLQSKIDVATRVNNDLNNLLNSIEIAILFLDKDLQIRQFTHQATKIFKFLKSDIGRLFTDMVTDLDYPQLFEDAKEVLRTLVFIEKQVTTQDGRWFNIRIMPYRTIDDKIDGLVISFIDITKSKGMQAALQKNKSILQSFIQMVPSIIIGLSSEGKVIEFNPEAEKVFSCNREEVMNRKYVDLFSPELSRKEVEEQLNKLFKGESSERFVNRIKTMKGEQLKIEWMVHHLLDENGLLSGIIAIGTNINGHEEC